MEIFWTITGITHNINIQILRIKNENMIFISLETGSPVGIETPITEEDNNIRKPIEHLENMTSNKTDISDRSVTCDTLTGNEQADIIEQSVTAEKGQDKNEFVEVQIDEDIETNKFSDLIEVKDEIIDNYDVSESSLPKVDGEETKLTREEDHQEPKEQKETPVKPKIKLYMGYSGELIENSNKSGKKRKKRNKEEHKRLAKVAKISKKVVKEKHEMLETLQRIHYELPGHNWLEQKIKNNEVDPSQGGQKK